MSDVATPTGHPEEDRTEKLDLKQVLSRHPVLIFLGALVIGFSAGVASYQAILQIAKLDTVREGSYVPKDKLAGRFLRAEALTEIERLIEIGELTKDDNSSRVWLLRTLTFVHEIDLGEDTSWQGVKMSTVERNIRWALTDPKVQTQRELTIGVLQGLRAAFRIEAPSLTLRGGA